MTDTAKTNLNFALLTVSDTRTLDQDTSGNYLSEALTSSGHMLSERALLKDDTYAIRAQVSQWIASTQIQVILITGGTGFYDRDNTVGAVSVLFDKVIPGFGEVFRARSLEDIGMATLQSCAIGGMANRTAIFCLPGSTGACRLAWEQILETQLDSRTKPCNFVAHLTRD